MSGSSAQFASRATIGITMSGGLEVTAFTRVLVCLSKLGLWNLGAGPGAVMFRMEF